MRSSKMAVFHAPDQPFTLETAEVPALRDGELLIQNEYATLCRSDLNTYCGKRREKTPTILGHEIVGRIAELGPAAPDRDCRGRALRVGDRVTWAIYAADPNSSMARRGLPQKGRDLFKYGHERLEPGSTLHGGLAEYCILRRHTPIVRIDAPIPLPVLALINCSVATVAGSLRLAGSLAGRNVLLAGAGMLGVVACAMARCAGAQKIIAVDIDAERLATAMTFGADFVVKSPPSGPALREALTGFMGNELLDVVIDYSGVPEAMEMSLGALGVGGTAVFIGATFPQRPIQINAEQIIRQVHTIRGLHNYNEADFVAAVEFIEQNHARFPFESLIHDHFTLDSVPAAFAHACQSNAHRVGIRLR